MLRDACITIGEPLEEVQAKNQNYSNFESLPHVWNTLVMEDQPATTCRLSPPTSSETKPNSTTSEPMVENDGDQTDEAYADCLLNLPLPFQGHQVPGQKVLIFCFEYVTSVIV